MSVITISESLSKLSELEKEHNIQHHNSRNNANEDVDSQIANLINIQNIVTHQILDNYALNRPRYNYYLGNVHFQLAVRFSDLTKKREELLKAEDMYKKESYANLKEKQDWEGLFTFKCAKIKLERVHCLTREKHSLSKEREKVEILNQATQLFERSCALGKHNLVYEELQITQRKLLSSVDERSIQEYLDIAQCIRRGLPDSDVKCSLAFFDVIRDAIRLMNMTEDQLDWSRSSEPLFALAAQTLRALLSNNTTNNNDIPLQENDGKQSLMKRLQRLLSTGIHAVDLAVLVKISVSVDSLREIFSSVVLSMRSQSFFLQVFQVNPLYLGAINHFIAQCNPHQHLKLALEQVIIVSQHRGITLLEDAAYLRHISLKSKDTTILQPELVFSNFENPVKYSIKKMTTARSNTDTDPNSSNANIELWFNEISVKSKDITQDGNGNFVAKNITYIDINNNPTINSQFDVKDIVIWFAPQKLGLFVSTLNDNLGTEFHQVNIRKLKQAERDPIAKKKEAPTKRKKRESFEPTPMPDYSSNAKSKVARPVAKTSAKMPTSYNNNELDLDYDYGMKSKTSAKMPTSYNSNELDLDYDYGMKSKSSAKTAPAPPSKTSQANLKTSYSKELPPVAKKTSHSKEALVEKPTKREQAPQKEKSNSTRLFAQRPKKKSES